MDDRMASRVWWTLALVAGVAAGSGACAAAPEPRTSSTSNHVPMAMVEPTPVTANCVPAEDRPAAGLASVREIAEQGVVLVRYSATPRDAPCETLDILFRMQGGMMVGAPGGQVELMWTAERAPEDAAEVSFLVGSPAVAMPTELNRHGSRVEVSTRVPVEAVLSYHRERRPTFEVIGRRIELSDVQALYLHRFLRRIPFHGVVEPRQSLREKADEARHAGAAPTHPTHGPVEPAHRMEPRADPRESAREDGPLVDRSESGWFCFEAASDDGSGKGTSACLRTAEECEASRGGTQAMGRAAGRCRSSTAAECYDWRVGPRSARSCFYRPEQCRRDEARRRAKEGDAFRSQGCYRTE